MKKGEQICKSVIFLWALSWTFNSENIRKISSTIKKILQKKYLKMLLHSGHFCDEKNDPQFSKVSCLKIWVFICYSCAVSLTVRRLCHYTLQRLAYLFIFHTVCFVLKIIPMKIQKKKNIEVCGNIGF